MVRSPSATTTRLLFEAAHRNQFASVLSFFLAWSDCWQVECTPQPLAPAVLAAATIVGLGDSGLSELYYLGPNSLSQEERKLKRLC